MQTGGAKVQTTNLPIRNNFLEVLQKLSFFNNNNKKKKPYWLLITSPQKESSKASAAQQQAEKAK